MDKEKIRNLTWRGSAVNVKVKDMEPSHLRNATAMLKRRIGTSNERPKDKDWLYVVEMEAYYRMKDEIETKFNEVREKNIRGLKRDMR